MYVALGSSMLAIEGYNWVHWVHIVGSSGLFLWGYPFLLGLILRPLRLRLRTLTLIPRILEGNWVLDTYMLGMVDYV